MSSFMKKIAALFLSAIFICIAAGCNSAIKCGEEQNDVSETGKIKFSKIYYEYFDTVSTIVGYEETQEEFDKRCEYICAELERYNKLYDIYHKYDGINNICTLNDEAANGPVKVDKDIIALLKFSIEMYEATFGKTNIAMGNVLSIWHDYREKGNFDPSNAELPPMDKLKAAAEHCSIEDIVIDEENSTVFFNDPLLKLDVGSVAKGYSTERIALDLIETGAENYALNIGGNVRTTGQKGDGTSWSAGIQNPDLTNDKTLLIKVIVDNKTLVTSGDYQRYYYVDGVKYHHIIDSKTLMPENYFASVSILSGDSGMADALSTACFNLSLDEGMKLINSLENTEAMWVTPDGNEYFSDHFLDYELKD